jgi:hypothetical protein
MSAEPQGGELSPQLTAFFTSARIRASSAAVNVFNAKAVGHMAPSSRFVLSLKPNVGADPPVRLPVLDSRQLLSRSELTPPDTSRAVVDERRMRPAFPHPPLLERPALLGGAHTRRALLVEVEAPAPTPHPAVILHQTREVGPGLGVEGLRGEFHGTETTAREK